MERPASKEIRALLKWTGPLLETILLVASLKVVRKIGQKQPTMASLKRAINAGSTFCGAQPDEAADRLGG